VNFVPRDFHAPDTRRAPYDPMLRARAKSFCHVWAGFKPVYQIIKGQPVCQIWRLYSHFGLKTYRVFCSCGKEFH
jgi:hypothetical protein